MIPDVLGYTLNEAKTLLDLNGIDYLTEVYNSPKLKEFEDIYLSSRIVKIVHLEEKKVKLILCNF